MLMEDEFKVSAVTSRGGEKKKRFLKLLAIEEKNKNKAIDPPKTNTPHQLSSKNGPPKNISLFRSNLIPLGYVCCTNTASHAYIPIWSPSLFGGG